jgi:hypothetical protein
MGFIRYLMSKIQIYVFSKTHKSGYPEKKIFLDVEIRSKQTVSGIRGKFLEECG